MSSNPVTPSDTLRTGGLGQDVHAARMGYIPLPLAHIPEADYAQIPFYIRAGDSQGGSKDANGFVLYRSGEVAFTARERRRLLHNGIEFVYIRMADQHRFREEVEANLEDLAKDSTAAVSHRSAMVYETSLALVNELLADQCFAEGKPRIKRVARAVTSLIVDDPTAFSHLFAASHHDFYTATHMVNVAVYLVGLSYAMGYRDPAELTRIGEAGLFHDIGKVYIPEEVLNKPGKLSDVEWQLLGRHAEMGYTHLSDYDNIDPLALTVTRQHHERMDGSGYPDGLSGDVIDPVSRMCAVVDSFDAMTALRPFKKNTLSVSDAMGILEREAPEKYDAEAVTAWISLMRSITGEEPAVAPSQEEPGPVGKAEDRRTRRRYRFNCPARLHIMQETPDGWTERPAVQIIAHNISTLGLGVMSQVPIRVGELVHVYLHARAWNAEYLEAITVRCRSFRDGWYEIGMELITKAESDRSAAQEPTIVQA